MEIQQKYFGLNDFRRQLYSKHKQPQIIDFVHAVYVGCQLGCKRKLALVGHLDPEKSKEASPEETDRGSAWEVHDAAAMHMKQTHRHLQHNNPTANVTYCML